MSVEPELAWFKSSYSTGDGGECVEVAMQWRKSSFSTGSGGECVEVAVCPYVVHVRDSKDIARHGIAVDAAAWTAFVGFAGR
ncbi:DUF397 domain-containing protein [Streptomyces sp. NBC_00878]|uniref:DUF397 domain-containing protein n=1 Tax=Streptomyces sp. NBC_00878 TaxID=2975854 RepID=UPI00224CE779|nr:DUF397 domain-containing protein [Streptomyces sp. NBC_00878]MCX4904827.1 DUF397 domain-containing protein [Streptomyces sp. NBC_00878]